ncbi:hypothetical protein LPJ56_000137 [Coemansia sp. RSA 2599]|nr:hypothetical protein LPJ75_000055 [Coemansia sp. RSA 2598]KAJ1829618.1 hypothetical protein LPJ56_000137 [Coemansia sp. RSA 2599]
MCVDEMRMGIMAQNCATPGFATLSFMLSTSVAGHVDWDFSGVLAEAIAKSADDSWVKSYIHGISQEIYQAHVPNSLIGKSFFKAARYFYRCHGIIIFCVGSFSQSRSPFSHMAHHPSIDSDSGYYQVLLAPRNYVLQKYDMLFAISTDVQSVLDAMVYAERVSIKSAKIEKQISWKKAAIPQASVAEDPSATNTPPPSPRSPNRLNLLGMFSAAYSSTDTAAGSVDRLEEGAPIQIESPRRMVARSPGANSRRRPNARNYISDSDSSYFSPGRNIDAVVHSSAFPNTGGAEREGTSGTAAAAEAALAKSRIERIAARRGDLVPQDISNHIVICDASDAFPRNMEILVRALKNAFGSDELPVVILTLGDPDAQTRATLGDFSHVYHVRGTPLAQSDLRRTRIEGAQKAIVLGNCNTRTYADGTSEASTDSAAILANMNIQSVCGGQFFVTTEILDIENIRYLDHTQLLGEPLLKRTFMGGHIFMPAMLDTALCQCYFSSHILDVLRHLTFSHLRGTQETDAIRPFKPGKLSLLYVPERFVGRRYDTLVLTLMKQHAAVPLGLYRFVTHDAQTFATVLCNPLPATPLLPSDAVYVLGPQISGWRHFSEGLRALAIAPQPSTALQSASIRSSRETKDGAQSSASGQSRHTVYSHNTEPDSCAQQSPAIKGNESSSALVFTNDAADDADVSDLDARDNVSNADTNADART